MFDELMGAHVGEDFYILGSGASLIPLVGDDPPYDFSWLEGKRVIAISHTSNYFDGASYMVVLDPPATRNLKNKPGASAPFHTICSHTVSNSLRFENMKKITVVKTCSEVSDNFRKGLYSAMSSSYVAVNAAILMGARRIYLLGHDACAVDGRTHWYNVQDTKGYTPAGGGKRYERMLNGWAKFKGKAEIVNLSMHSKIPYFPKYDPLEHFENERLHRI